ncbi:MAG: hypothetical protein HQ557_01970 [Bacteroidetes bacterium]|nr:hypothetical protein [Bacteroidota bacterium]
MPTLQVRDLPEDVYLRLALLAKEENRSITQQTIVLLKESLGLHLNNKLRRKALISGIAANNYPDTMNLNIIDMIREDRER